MADERHKWFRWSVALGLARLRVALGTWVAVALVGGCPDRVVVSASLDAADVSPGDTADSDRGDGADANDDGSTEIVGGLHLVTVTVTLDGAPQPGVTVVQGGTEGRWVTGPEGVVEIEVDLDVVGEVGIVASHPEARTKGAEVYRTSLQPMVSIGLVRFVTEDNSSYIFQHPGEPDASLTTSKCGHCHVTINQDWFESPHRTSAKNPRLHDVYSGRALSAFKPSACASLGGVWAEGQIPGSAETALGCYNGPGLLPALSPGCSPGVDCETNAKAFGQCADCHAPGIDGDLGGRNLLEARGVAHDYGVHCDICHKVESVVLDAPAGVGGRLQIHRPSEPASISLGGILPIQFGPNPDVPNIRMGNVPREHFHTAALCAGCHELDQPVLVGASIDMDRWPSGRLPIHSTYSEWKASSLSPSAPCQSCHMPPDPGVANSADLQLFPGASVGTVGGWHRPPGAVRQHRWIGPRSEGSKMLENAAALFVDVSSDGLVHDVTVTTKNVGPAHAVPTGEPMRSLVLVVDGSCDGVPLGTLGGDAVSSVGGALAVKVLGDDWASWLQADVGDRVRVTAWSGGYRDYDGFGPFGDGTFDVTGKGWREEFVAGESLITTIVDGVASYDPPLATGDVAYLVRSDTDFAGRPGVDFARVLTGANGEEMVPHFAAVDVARDNRLLPQTAWTSLHQFGGACVAPQIQVTLYHLDVPAGLARSKGWERRARLMAQVTR